MYPAQVGALQRHLHGSWQAHGWPWLLLCKGACILIPVTQEHQAVPSSLLGTAAISPREGGGHTLDCVQGSCPSILQAGGSGHRARLAVGRTHGIVCSRSEPPCRHLSSASKEMPADAAGLLSHDYWAAAEASPGCFI